MTARKPQNSILVIATLGVYFGLMLAGATPQVLANAAMTRQFDVRDEIELHDDLDTKPDDERSPVTTSVQIYVEDVELFLKNLAALAKRGEFDPKADTFSVAQNTLLPCVDSNLAGRYTPIRFETSRPSQRGALENLSRGMVYGYSLGDCIANPEFSVKAAESRYNFSLDGKAFAINVTVKKESQIRAIDLVRQLESTLKLYSTPTSSKLRQAVARYTTFRPAGDQVMVVTRLPRSGLISLLLA